MSLLILSLISFAASQFPYTPPDFDIDLDAPAETRWQEVFECKKADLKKLTIYLDSFINYFEKKYFSELILLSGVFSQENLKEMQSLADFLETDIYTIIIGNLANELTSRCTSFLVRNTKGEIILSRNMDFGYTEMLQNLTINAHFYKSGKLLYHSITSAGFFGVSTGMKPNSFAISINQRDLKDDFALWELVGLFEGSKMAGFSVRHAIENFNLFEEVVDYFIEVPLIVGEYIAIAGLTEAVVITRNRKYVSDYNALDEENWFIVQTNYDHWLPQPKYDDRYTEVVKRVEETGQENVDEEMMTRFLEMKPTLRPTTVFSAVANPSTGYWDGFGWEH